MTPRTMRILAALAATAAVTACTTTADGTPHPQSSAARPDSSASATPTSSSSTSAENEAPRVTAPLDASAFVAAPCTTLTSAQLPAFAVNPPGEVRELEGVPQGCSWHGPDGSISIGWLYQNRGGLSDTYRRGDELNAYFIETSVDGYPGVFTAAVDDRADGSCGLIVGVTDSLTFLAGVDNSKLDADTSCDQAKQVASAALATIKEAN